MLKLRKAIESYEAPQDQGSPQPITGMRPATTSTAPQQGTVHQVPQVDKAHIQTPADPLAQARDAISRGASRAAVIQRLREHGIDPTGL
jgi:hypothetical protein